MDLSTLLYLSGALLILTGLLGVVLPVLPGVPVMYLGMLLVAWSDGFERIGFWTLLALALLTGLSILADLLSSILGAQRVGASRLALIGATLGALIGLFFGLPGVVLGPFIGAFAGELLHSRRGGLATKVGVATWIGLVLGAIAKLCIALMMLGLFVLVLMV